MKSCLAIPSIATKLVHSYCTVCRENDPGVYVDHGGAAKRVGCVTVGIRDAEPEGFMVAHLTPDEADALAADLQRTARLARINYATTTT